MKKSFLLISLPLLMLAACNNSPSGAVPTDEREKVTLTASNFSKYIAVYTISDTYSTSYTYSLYRYQLVGSNLCKFDNCKIEYTFANSSGNLPETYATYSINLTISGCGESKEVSVSYYNQGKSSSYFYFYVLSASGTVEILY